MTINWCYLQDSIWEKMPQEGNKAAELQWFTNETQFLRLFLEEDTSAPATVCIQHLQHIARLRVTLTMAAQLISDRLPGKLYVYYCIALLQFAVVCS